MPPRPLDAVVVGAGQAGLAMAYVLKEAQCDFVVFEHGRIGETWRSQRWDSFVLNTPNWANGLPGMSFDAGEKDGFGTRNELVAFMERYVEEFALPVQTGTTVTAVERDEASNTYRVTTRSQRDGDSSVTAQNVIVASGIMQRPRVPKSADAVPDSMLQLHTGEYRSPSALPSGPVLVVGGGQSGCQIAQDLLASGREVYLGTSHVGRLPRRYRGRDMLDWWQEMGFLAELTCDLEDPSVQYATQPQISGIGRYGRTVSLQQLAKDGVRLLGRLESIENGVATFDGSLAANIRFGDEKSAQFKKAIDEYLAAKRITPPPIEDDEADVPHPDPEAVAAPTTLDLQRTGIGTIIWCTGFTADFSWLRVPATDGQGRPLHEEGVGNVPGLYFVGFPWLRRRQSGIILGVEDDARHVLQAIQRS